MACASLESTDDPSTTSSRGDVPGAPISSTDPTGDGLASTTSPNDLSPGVQLMELGKEPTVPGMSLRWMRDTSRCMARSSMNKVQGDRIVIVACNSDARQAFYITPDKTIGVGNNLCIGRASDSNEAQLTTCGDGTVAEVKVTGSTMQLLNLGSNTPFVIRPQNATATLGQALVFSEITLFSDIYGWDFVGVGNKGGMLIPLLSTTACLSRNGASLALEACDASRAVQRWRYDVPFLVNDAGGCIACDLNSRACNMATCDPNASNANSRFAFSSTNGTLMPFSNLYGGFFSASSATATPSINNEKLQLWQFGSAL